VKAVGETVRAFDSMARQVTDFATGGKADRAGPYHYRYEGEGLELSAKQGDKIVQTISGHELQERLDPTQLRHVEALQKSMEASYSIWVEVYPQLPLVSDPITKAQLNQRLSAVTADIGRDLAAILEFLQSCGLVLDDHYMHIRSLLNR
jgi:hypothetical protein